jgi:hypothetical protein
VVLVLVLAGCAAPIADEREPSDPFEDPERDVMGWENGYWADEPVPVRYDDGLNGTERRGVVARAMARVERVRGVEFRRGVSVEVVSRSEFANGSVSGNGGGDSPGALYRDVRYEALFLLGEDTRGDEATSRNDRQSVQGYYDTRADRIVLVSPTETPRIDEGTLAQELFHAFQFRNLLPRRIPALATYDGRQAVLSVIEGDANLVQYRYERRCEGNWSCLSGAAPADGDASGGGDGGDGSAGGRATRGGGSGVRMGIYLLQYFPYAEGEQYVREVQASAGWDGVDALYDELPTTSAAVIHRTTVDARPVELPAAARDGWRPVERPDRGDFGTAGEAGLAGMFAYTLYDGRNATVVDPGAFLNRRNGSLSARNPLDYGLAPSTGWRGDRFRVFRHDEGATGYVWRIAFADPGAAREFLGRYRELLGYRGARTLGDGDFRIPAGRFADAFSVRREGDTVTVVNAPTLPAVAAIAPDSPEE